MFTPRLLRRRWVLALIFVFSLIYFISNIFKQTQYDIIEDIRVEAPRRQPEIKWAEDSGHQDIDKTLRTNSQVPNNNTVFRTCRNSVQGRAYITDDKGYTCERNHVVAGGCCDTDHPNTRRYVCDTCQKNGCCEIYEHCVSCCLQPEKQSLLRKILGQAQDSFQHLFASVTDHFELCLAKCRTSSQSVQHENSYRDPRAKFCYGENPPDVQPLVP